MITTDQHHLYLRKSDLEPADCPPKGYHYDPYTKAWRKNLTEAEVQTLWPYALPKKETQVEPIRHWLDDALDQVAPKPNPDELHAPPTRLLDGSDGSAVERGRKVVAQRVPKEKVEEVQAVMAAANVFNTPDNVVLPEHYARFKLEPIRFICENGLNFFQGNIIKYTLRYDAKNGLEDLKKARRYLNMFILYVEGDPDWWKAS